MNASDATRASRLAAAAALTLMSAMLPGRVGAVDRPALAGSLQISKAAIVVMCPLTVGGSLEAKTNDLDGELELDTAHPGLVVGILAVDLRTLQTGIALRDAHMREKYLEVGRGSSFAVARLDRIRLTGADLTRLDGPARFEGTLRLHGQERVVSGTADMRRSGQTIRVQATFPVKVSDFGITSATYLGVGVEDEVTVSVRFQISPKRS
jgi:polyisoprenoid-binding protein YceI